LVLCLATLNLRQLVDSCQHTSSPAANIFLSREHLMDLISTTPFGQRPITAGLMQRAMEAQGAVQATDIDKWSLFRDLCTARHAYGISDRDLTVLNALLSFHKSKSLSNTENLIVYPSNRTLSERAHGMAESTLRRHLAALSNAGLIQRHDSPNGKRYAARGQGGTVIRAFGFDLRPLLVRAQDITHAAAEAQAAANRMRRLREEVIILKRDALKLCQFGQENGIAGDWVSVEAQLLSVHKLMRRKVAFSSLEALAKTLRLLITNINTMLETLEMGGSDAQNERHYQNSDKDSSVFEPDLEHEKISVEVPVDMPLKKSNLPLTLVLKACPDILPYAQGAIRGWNDLVRLAEFVRGMMGISPDAWKRAVTVMGPETAAVTVAGILQRIADIQNPGGYLRTLSNKAEAGSFSPGPMIMALLNRS
jgi:replication initiation protein RepC